MSSKPNFLIIQADQLTDMVLSSGGNALADTPHLDDLAANATVFRNAYCNFPLCAPSRMAMLTGRLSSSVGVYDNACAMNSEIPTYAHYLRVQGYHTCLSGKMHFVGPDQLHGFEERMTTDIYPADFLWTENVESRDPRHKSDDRGVTLAGICDRSPQLDYDDQVMFHAQQKLYDLAHSSDQRPWLLHVSMTHPHDPYYCSQSHWDRYQNRDIPLPTVPRLPIDEQDKLSRFINERHCLDKDFADQQILSARRGYLGSVSYFDDQVGKLVDRLRQLGLEQNTVVIITSDHGDMLGERGMWFKRHHFEWASRIPLMVSAPGRMAHSVIEQPVSLVDLLPTLLVLAGDDELGSLVEPIDGQSLVEPPAESLALAETMSDGLDAPILMVRKGRYKWISGPQFSPLLYDLRDDPHEQHNIAAERDSLCDEFSRIVEKTWDTSELQRSIEKSTPRRLLIRASHGQGVAPRWDYPSNDVDQARWCRSGSDYNTWAFNVLNPR